MSDSATAAEAARAGTRSVWARVAALVLAGIALGVPINNLFAYALLVIAALLIFCGRLTCHPGRWLAAIAAVAAAASVSLLMAPAPVMQGFNVFLPTKPGNVFERKLPSDVYRALKAEFDALYPPSIRCKPGSLGCWQDDGQPGRLYAFSADSLFAGSDFSRAVTGIDFADPVRLRLGFVNDKRYNWYTAAPDVHRADRDGRVWMGLHRWHITMPWYVMLRFPVDYVGSRLCWRGEMLWPDAHDHYEPLRNGTLVCRPLAPEDIGRSIFGAAIKPGSLAVVLHPPAAMQVRLITITMLQLLAVFALLILLVRAKPRDLVRPVTLIVLALIVIAVIDASFIGGLRPMDGGDDGLFYTGTGRQILEHLVHGNILATLAGGEDVYYYGGPGLRYWRALEMIVFGDTNLGYLSLVLLMPMIVLGLFKRFLSDTFAWRLTLVFTALPVGEIVGTCFIDYAKWAARGFADPAAHIFLVAGVWVMAGMSARSENRFATAAGGALLCALAVFTKPVVGPIAGVVLGGAGLAALWQRQWRRLIGMCVGFLPVVAMPLHNWYFGHQLVLLSTNADIPSLLVMPPSAWLAALAELVRLDFAGPHLHTALMQIVGWLSGPGERAAFLPFNAVAVAIVVYVVLRGRDFDPWLRLIGAAVMAEYAVDLIYVPTQRYFFSTWLLSIVVVAVFIERRLPGWLAARNWPRGKQMLERLIGGEPAQA